MTEPPGGAVARIAEVIWAPWHVTVRPNDERSHAGPTATGCKRNALPALAGGVRCHKCELKTPSTILAPTNTSNITAMCRKLCWNFGISSTEAKVRAGHSLQDVKQNRLIAITNKTVLAITQAVRPVDGCSAPGKSSRPMPVRATKAA